MSSKVSTEVPAPGTVDMNLEVIVIPVSDVDRSKEFYTCLGWRLDADVAADEFRSMQFTPPSSGCSMQFGKNLTSAAPGFSPEPVPDRLRYRGRTWRAGRCGRSQVGPAR